MQLTGLAVHPLKSGAIRPVHYAEVLPRGLADDRLFGGRTMFAVHLVPLSGGNISVGDGVSAE